MCLTACSLPYGVRRHSAARELPWPGVPTWTDGTPGLVQLPSGRRVRGRAWRDVVPGPSPDLGIYLLARAPASPPWDMRWVRWRDFALPEDPSLLRTVLVEALDRSGDERVEVACSGGTGRTGTTLACLAVLDGVRADEAVEFVRERYRHRAVETRAQAAFVTRFR